MSFSTGMKVTVTPGSSNTSGGILVDGIVILVSSGRRVIRRGINEGLILSYSLAFIAFS